jgi:hypothetical protein
VLGGEVEEGREAAVVRDVRCKVRGCGSLARWTWGCCGGLHQQQQQQQQQKAGDSWQ